MINLLPPDAKSHYRYALRNTFLRRWAISAAIALAGLLVIGGAGYVYMAQISSSYDDQIASSNDSLKQQQLSQTQAKVKDISNSLKLAVAVLSKEVLFSQLLKQLGNVTPNNTILSNLTISQDDKAIDVTAKATDYNAATQVQVNLSDPANKIFSKADIISITCDSNNEGVSTKYPCTVIVRALLAQDTQFLFLNNGVRK
jgi:hypothetical protein